jgi:hypothetical protein
MMIEQRDPYALEHAQIARLLAGDDRPAPTMAGNLANAGSKVLQAYMLRRQMDEAQGRRQQTAATVKNALDIGTGSPAGLDPATGISWDTARAPDHAGMARALAGNPDTAGMGLQLAMQQQERQQGNEQWKSRFETEQQAAEARQQRLLEAQRQRDEANNRTQLDAARISAGARQPHDRYTVTPRGVLDKQTGEIIPFAGANASGNPPPQGFAGGVPSADLYITGDKVDQGQANRDQIAGNKIRLDASTAAQKAAADRGTIASMRAAVDQPDAIDTGETFTGLKAVFNRALATVGNDKARSRVNAYDTLEAGSTAMARGERQPGEGAVSDYESKLFARIVPGNNRLPEFNRRALEARDMADARAQEYPLFLDEFRKRNSNLVGAEAAWQRYVNDNPVFRPGLDAGQIDLNKPESFANPQFQTWRQYFGVEEGPQVASGGGRSAAAGADPSLLLAEARDAIAKGAPRDAVIAELKRMNIDPAGL